MPHTSLSQALSPIHVLLVGFGRHAKTTSLAYCMACESADIRIEAVTCLAGGVAEYETSVLPFFHEYARRQPVYIATLADALKYMTARPNGVVIISTPSALHYSQAVQAANSNCHVFIEKPAAMTPRELRSLVSLAGKHRLACFTEVQRRTEVVYRYIYDCIKNGTSFGSLSKINCSLAVGERPTGWRLDRSLSGGGVLIDSGYHMIDCAVWMLEAAGIEVRDTECLYAITEQWPTITKGANGIESTALAYLKINDRVELSVDFTYVAPKNSIYEHFDVIDDTGTRITLIRNQQQRSSRPGHVTHQLADGTAIDPSAGGHAGEAITMPPVPANDPIASLIATILGSESDSDHPCLARKSITTLEIVKRIYDYAR